ncbi:MAG: hypothetical protein VB099_07065 [Candidatus Limiplasma sp.]|nr:hypothetical protein [Candidatus Limiplasma sp.]
MARNKLSGADYLLYFLFCDNQQPICGAIRLTKMMFLFEKEIMPLLADKGLDSDHMPEFIAYNFGPFSKDVYEQIELFKNISFITVESIPLKEDLGESDDWEEDESGEYLQQSDGMYYKYKIAKRGRDYVEQKIEPLLTEEHKAVLVNFKKQINLLTPKKILYYVYSKYPDFTTNSLIKDEVLGE